MHTMHKPRPLAHHWPEAITDRYTDRQTDNSNSSYSTFMTPWLFLCKPCTSMEKIISNCDLNCHNHDRLCKITLFNRCQQVCHHRALELTTVCYINHGCFIEHHCILKCTMVCDILCCFNHGFPQSWTLTTLKVVTPL